MEIWYFDQQNNKDTKLYKTTVKSLNFVHVLDSDKKFLFLWRIYSLKFVSVVNSQMLFCS